MKRDIRAGMVVLLLIVVCLLLGAKAEAGALDGGAAGDGVWWELVMVEEDWVAMAR